MWSPGEIGDGACDGEPVFAPGELNGEGGGPDEVEVGIAPGGELWVFAEVFVADVDATEEGFAAVDDDDFAVLAEVDLEASGGELDA